MKNTEQHRKLKRLAGEDKHGVRLIRLATPLIREGKTAGRAIKEIIFPWIPHKWLGYSGKLKKNILDTYEPIK